MLDENKGAKFMYVKKKISSFPDKLKEYNSWMFLNFPTFFLKGESLHMITRKECDLNTSNFQV
jgi:hypothetical protein